MGDPAIVGKFDDTRNPPDSGSQGAPDLDDRTGFDDYRPIQPQGLRVRIWRGRPVSGQGGRGTGTFGPFDQVTTCINSGYNVSLSV